MLNELRTLIQKAAPQVVEMISYDMPTYKLDGQRLVYFAAWKQHVGIYALPNEVLDQFADEVASFRQPKGTLQFPYSQPLPSKLIRALVSANMKRLKSVEA